MKRFILSLFVVILLFLGSVFLYVRHYLESSFNKEDNVVLVDKGRGLFSFIDKLEKKQIIKHKFLFKIIYFSKTKNNLHLKYGDYFFQNGIKIKDIIKKLQTGDIIYHKITFAEGLSTKSIIDKINNNDILEGENIDSEEEGVLMPNTYFFVRGETKQGLIKRMKNDMNKALDSLWEDRNINIPIKSKQQALILASIVEKETGIPSERYLVASVFINRLRKRMKLQTDPTIVYAFAFGDVSKERKIYLSDLKRESPYNTYLHYGLPPTPICNPGYDSIKAVLQPIETNYLYFVATGNGGHNFSTTYKEHRKFVKNYRELLKN